MYEANKLMVLVSVPAINTSGRTSCLARLPKTHLMRVLVPFGRRSTSQPHQRRSAQGPSVSFASANEALFARPRLVASPLPFRSLPHGLQVLKPVFTRLSCLVCALHSRRVSHARGALGTNRISGSLSMTRHDFTDATMATHWRHVLESR